VATISGYSYITHADEFSQKDYKELGIFEGGIPDAWIFVLDGDQNITDCILIEAKDNDTAVSIEQIGSYARTFLKIDKLQEFRDSLKPNTWRSVLEYMQDLLPTIVEETAKNLVQNFVEVIRWYGVPEFSRFSFEIGFFSPLCFPKAMLHIDLQDGNFNNFQGIGVQYGHGK
jgi:hypothetical protein